MIANATEMQKFLQDLKRHANDGRIFEVTFIKRTTGERRSMVCRLGVKSHLKGGKKAYDARKHDLLTVFDMQAREYRSIALDSVLSARVNGITYRVL